MAWHFDQYDRSIVIDGWEKGIADDPFEGIADIRNANILSVPGEASVGFATQSYTPPSLNMTVTSVNANVLSVSFTTGTAIDTGVAVKFTAVGGLTGVSTNTVYWAGNVSNFNFKLYSDYALSSVVAVAGAATGSPTLVTYDMAQPKDIVYAADTNATYWMIDSSGQVWNNKNPTTVNSYWRFTGNTTLTNANGNGIAYYQSSNGNGYIFAFRNHNIDYTPTGTVAWTYAWNTMQTASGTNNPHKAILAPDNRVYYCDGTYVGRFYETTPGTPFDPTNAATYTFSPQSLLPNTDTAQCLAFLGTSLLVGGKRNVIYPWDRSSTNFSYPLLLPEYNVAQMVTVNTNTYIFIGNRGRIYVTNGTNVDLWKKMPDHISGTVEPYFTWGGACTQKNQIYFSCFALTNAGGNINQYGGIWAISTDTGALRLTNQLSYGTYAGYATAIAPDFSTDPTGTGLYIGWTDGNSNYGIDHTTSNPYTGSQSILESDLIPIGTYQSPRDLTKVEYRLTRPLVSGESITIKSRLVFDASNTGYTTMLTDSTVGNYSNIGDVNFKNAQWIQFQAVLNSTVSSPSYVRLKELRILGLQGPTLQQSQILSL